MSYFYHSGLGGINVPSEVLRDPRLKPTERMVLMTLCMFADNKTAELDRSLLTISELCGVGTNNLSAVINQLMLKGWIEKVQGNHHRVNHYKITLPREGGVYAGETWHYRRESDKRLSREEAARKAARNLAKIEADRAAAKARSGDYWAMSREELLDQLDQEEAAERVWVSQAALDQYFLVRGEDNSEEACLARKEAFEAAKAARPELPPSGLTRQQVIDIGFSKAGPDQLDDETLRFYNFNRAFFD